MSNSLKLLENILGSNSKVAALRVLLQSKVGYSGKEVARRAGMGLLAIQNTLADLEGCGLVEVHRGRVEHRYRVNIDHYLVQHGLRQLYAGEREMLKSLAHDLRKILEGKVVAAGLFGSAARGEAKSGSDIDLLVIVNTAKGYEQVNKILIEPVQILSKRYGWPIQQVVYKQKDLFKNAHAMTDLLVNVERDWVHIAGEDLHKLRNEFVHERVK
jgi:uncharacterized protein